MSSIREREMGFTLVELLISMAIAGIVMASIYSSYYSQQKAYVTQEQVAGMQQNLRAAMYHLERDIRMAGYDPTGKAGAKIEGVPSATSFQLTKDDNNNSGTGIPDGDVADANEDIKYSLDANRLRKDPGNQTVAENIDALNFVYLDEDGAVTATVDEMRSVQISIVARTSRPDPGHTDTTVYRNLQNTIIYPPGGVYPPDDTARFRRKMLRVEVRCRNIGI